MRRISVSVLLSVLSLTMLTCTSTRYSTAKRQPEIRNVILMIGDGMGLATISSAITVSDHTLNIIRCKTIGLQKTNSTNNYITDSAAAGTALATGNKTNNGVIGMDPKGVRVKSILEISEQNGLATGLVSTSSITHATPASFIAHQENRGSYEDIALDFLKTDIDVFIGGGYDHFAKRKDNLNLTDSLKARGYEVASSLNQVLSSTSGRLAGLVAPVHTPYRLRGRGDMLPQSSVKAVEILSKSKKGFFLMIEGSQIDWAGHANVADTLVDETIDFDNAIGKVLDFAVKDGHTLVIITADHETGGVTITGGDIPTHKVKLNFSSKDHTPILIPVFAFGPGAENFNGIYENTEIFQKIMTAFRFTK
jgi:alkaline phosphatase